MGLTQPKRSKNVRELTWGVNRLVQSHGVCDARSAYRWRTEIVFCNRREVLAAQFVEEPDQVSWVAVGDSHLPEQGEQQGGECDCFGETRDGKPGSSCKSRFRVMAVHLELDHGL